MSTSPRSSSISPSCFISGNLCSIVVVVVAAYAPALALVKAAIVTSLSLLCLYICSPTCNSDVNSAYMGLLWLRRSYRAPSCYLGVSFLRF